MEGGTSIETSKEDIAYADDLLTRCDSLINEQLEEYEDDRVVFSLEKDSDVFGDDEGKDVNFMFLGFVKGNGKPLPEPSKESVQKAQSLLGHIDPIPPPESCEDCGFKNGKGEPWNK